MAGKRKRLEDQVAQTRNLKAKKEKIDKGEGKAVEVKDESVVEGITGESMAEEQYTRSPTPEEIRRIVDAIPRSGSRVSSTSRSNSTPMIRELPCVRCAKEFINFPDLVCSNHPTSVAGKCIDCQRKHDDCEAVPVCLHESLRHLMEIAEEFRNGFHNSNQRLQAAQWQFDFGLARHRNNLKAIEASVKDKPYLPVVQSLDSVVETLQENSRKESRLATTGNDNVVEAIQQLGELISEGFTSLSAEIRQLSRVQRDL